MLILHFYYTNNKNIIQIYLALAINTFFPHTHPVGSVSSQLDLFSESTQVSVDSISQCLNGLPPLTQKVDLRDHLRQVVPHKITYKQHNNARKSVDGSLLVQLLDKRCRRDLFNPDKEQSTLFIHTYKVLTT